MLQENSLYTSDAEMQALLSDKRKIMDALVINFFGFLGLFKLSHKRGHVKAYADKELSVRTQAITKDNLDVSLSIKLAVDAGCLKSVVANKMTRLLALVKGKRLTSKTLDENIIRELMSEINFDSFRPSPSILSIVNDFKSSQISLPQLSNEVWKLCKIKKELKSVSKEFRVMANNYSSYLIKIASSPSSSAQQSNAAPDNPAPQQKPTSAVPSVEKVESPKSSGATQQSVKSIQSKDTKEPEKVVNKILPNEVYEELYNFLLSDEKSDSYYKLATEKNVDTYSFNIKNFLSYIDSLDTQKYFHANILQSVVEMLKVFKISEPLQNDVIAKRLKMKNTKIFAGKFANEVRNVNALLSYEFPMEIFNGRALIDTYKSVNPFFFTDIGTHISNIIIGWLSSCSLSKESLSIFERLIKKLTPFELEKQFILELHKTKDNLTKGFVFYMCLHEDLRNKAFTPLILESIISNIFGKFLVGKKGSGRSSSFRVSSSYYDSVDKNSFEEKAVKFMDEYSNYFSVDQMSVSSSQLENVIVMFSDYYKNHYLVRTTTEFVNLFNINLKEINANDVIERIKGGVPDSFFFGLFGMLERFGFFVLSEAKMFAPLVNKLCATLFKLDMVEIRHLRDGQYASTLSGIFTRRFEITDEVLIEFSRWIVRHPDYLHIKARNGFRLITSLITSINFEHMTEYKRNLRSAFEEYFKNYDTDGDAQYVFANRWLFNEKQQGDFNFEFSNQAAFERFIAAPKSHNLTPENFLFFHKMFEKFPNAKESYKKQFIYDVTGDMLFPIIQNLNVSVVSRRAITNFGVFSNKEYENDETLLDSFRFCVKEGFNKKYVANDLGIFKYHPLLKKEFDKIAINAIMSSKEVAERNIITTIQYDDKEEMLGQIEPESFAQKFNTDSNGLKLRDAIFEKVSTKPTKNFIEKLVDVRVHMHSNKKQFSKPIREGFDDVYIKSFEGLYEKNPTATNEVFSKLKGAPKKAIVDYQSKKALTKGALESIYKDNVPIKPYKELNESQISHILTLNNVSLDGIKTRTIKTYSDLINKTLNADNLIEPLAVEQIEETEESLEKYSIEYDALNNRKHGPIGVKFLRKFSVNLKKQALEHEKFLKEHPTTKILPKAFHGCGSIAASFILRYGYTIFKSGNSGAVAVAGRMLGDGIYISDVITKAIQYATDEGMAPGRRGIGKVGYLFEQEAYLGTENIHYRKAGTTNDSIRSPEWAVYEPNAQLRIYTAYQTKIIHEDEMKNLKSKHGVVEGKPLKIEKFKKFLIEAVKKEDGYVSTFIFQDGAVPISKEKWVDFNEIKQEYEVEETPFGPMFIFRHDGTSTDFTDESFLSLSILDTMKDDGFLNRWFEFFTGDADE